MAQKNQTKDYFAGILVLGGLYKERGRARAGKHARVWLYIFNKIIYLYASKALFTFFKLDEMP